MKKKIIIILLAVVLLAAVIVLVVNLSKDPMPIDSVIDDTADITTVASDSKDVQTVKIEDMAETLASSQHKAKKEYLGNTVKFTGTFVEADPQETSYIVLCAITDDDSAAEVLFNCNLSTEDLRKQALKKNTGDQVTVVGTVSTVAANYYEITVSSLS